LSGRFKRFLTDSAIAPRLWVTEHPVRSTNVCWSSDNHHRGFTPLENNHLLKRLSSHFNIDVSTCEHCGGPARIVACIEDPKIIDRILNHLAARAPPQLPLLA
jgi:hypothetical protein